MRVRLSIYKQPDNGIIYICLQVYMQRPLFFITALRVVHLVGRLGHSSCHRFIVVLFCISLTNLLIVNHNHRTSCQLDILKMRACAYT